jgi:hypothetical protein
MDPRMAMSVTMQEVDQMTLLRQIQNKSQSCSLILLLCLQTLQDSLLGLQAESHPMSSLFWSLCTVPLIVKQGGWVSFEVVIGVTENISLNFSFK